ncbi:hypothetical protein K469DRAFT_517853, partial [Zopfia rhizophila CBS 207.26]
EIRLVTVYAGSSGDLIRCSLATASEDQMPSYEALSYGVNQDDYQTILLNGTAWYVTKNLAVALSYIRHSDRDRVVWIDALAINQADVPERNAQVIRIPTIYSRASSTLVWLGPA